MKKLSENATVLLAALIEHQQEVAENFFGDIKEALITYDDLANKAGIQN